MAHEEDPIMRLHEMELLIMLSDYQSKFDVVLYLKYDLCFCSLVCLVVCKNINENSKSTKSAANNQ